MRPHARDLADAGTLAAPRRSRRAAAREWSADHPRAITGSRGFSYDARLHPSPHPAVRRRHGGGGVHRVRPLQLHRRSGAVHGRAGRDDRGAREAAHRARPRPAVLRAVRRLRRQRGAGRLRRVAAPGPHGVDAAQGAAAGDARALASAAALLALVVGIPLGVYTALRRDSVARRTCCSPRRSSASACRRS